MGLLECTSGASLWRGYDYYKNKRVENLEKIDDSTFLADVKGNGENIYRVTIDVSHPRKSKCNCPHADGRRIICKHMIAVYFAAFPKEAKRVYDEYVSYQEEEERREEILQDRVFECIKKMTKNELQQTLFYLLVDGSDWQYENFVKEHRLDDDLYDV